MAEVSNHDDMLAQVINSPFSQSLRFADSVLAMSNAFRIAK
jgi:hypothetical protein